MFKWFQARPPSRGKTVPILRTRKFEGGPWEDDASSAPENPRSPTGTSWLEKEPTVLDRHVGRRCRLPDHAGRVALWRCLQTIVARPSPRPWSRATVTAGCVPLSSWWSHRPTEMSVLRAAWAGGGESQRGEKAAGCSQRPCEKTERGEGGLELSKNISKNPGLQILADPRGHFGSR